MKKHKLLLVIIILSGVFRNIHAQDSLFSFLPKNFEIHGLIDTYYDYNTDKSNSTKLFPTVSPYRDEFRLNIAQVSLKYISEDVRSTLTLHYGDIPDINWEPSTRYKFIQEANIGFSPANNLWIDVGYFQTHLGAEAFPPNNFLNSNALISVAEPNFQSGLKISYEFSKKFNAAFHLINGSNLFEDNNKNKSFGVQLNYLPKDNLQFTYNNIIGNEIPSADNNPRTRYLHNFVIDYSPTDKIDLLGNFDIGNQEKSGLADSSATAYVYGGLASIRYNFSKKFSTAFRCEYYQDLDGLLSGVVIGNTGAKGNGFTIGGEYKPNQYAYIRLEYYFLKMDDNQKIFYDNSSVRHELTFSFGAGF
jgi:hypothetical protein